MYDAPWESTSDSLTEAQEQKIRSNFIKREQETFPNPRAIGLIEYHQRKQIIGWVSRYGKKRFDKIFYAGINICEDEYLNHGLGSEALHLWVNYLFEHSNVHKTECHTWSLNPRMMRVMEKIGFNKEGQERELIQWRGKWRDRLRFGLIRREWEAKGIHN